MEYFELRQLNKNYWLKLRVTYVSLTLVLISTDKLDQVLDDTENTESMVNQVLYRSFTNQKGCDKALLPTGPEVQIIELSFIAWNK